MDQQQTMEAHWESVARALGQRWSNLNAAGLESFRHRPEELVAEIQRRTGESQETIRGFLEELSGQSGGDTMQAAREYAQRAGAAIQAAGSRVSAGFRSGYAGAGDAVRQRPGQALIAAFSAGIIVGTVVGLMMRPR